MIEIPEASVIAKQLNSELSGKIISYGVAGTFPNKFAWYSGKSSEYTRRLFERRIINSYNHASRVFIELDDGLALIFGEGTGISVHEAGDSKPRKHQLLLEFADDSALSVIIRMYGFILCENKDTVTNKYIIDAMIKPSPLSDGFTPEYFNKLFTEHADSSLSTKAFLATEQRIPGIGNGVLHDILFNAMIHPKLKLRDYNDEEAENLYNSIKKTLEEMADKGGRDTEKDIYGQKGGYKCIMSRNSVGKECPRCGAIIEKQSYMGGSVYFCPVCQRKE